MPRLSILLLPTRPPQDLATTASALEQDGISGLWVPDHLSGGARFNPPWYGLIPCLTTLATSALSIPIGPLVASPVLRPAPTLALDLVTIEAINPGHLRAAIGSGVDSDSARTQQPRPTTAQLATYCAHISTLLPTYLAGDTPYSVTLAGELKLSWVTVGGYGLVGPAKQDRIAYLKDIYHAAGGDSEIVVLVEPNEPSPWASPTAMATTLETWAALDVTEVVLFEPHVYSTPPAVLPNEAALIASHL